jgi:tRNA threonylcarbamoyladenosine dehydratase
MGNLLLEKLLTELEENQQYDLDIRNIIDNLKKYSTLSDSLKNKWVNNAQFVLSTLRNRLLISKDEQNTLKNKVVVFLGLSVGSHAVNSWMMESRAKTIKISDPDDVSPTNLNRLNSTWSEIGDSKVNVVKRNIFGKNPRTVVHSFKTQKISDIEQIIIKSPKADLIVEQVDNLEAKLTIRKLAKQYAIPVIMATDVGDNVFLDIERYDIDAKTKFFNDRIKNIENIDFTKLSQKDRIGMSVGLVGLEHNSERMLESLMSIGSKIKTWPQLGTTALIAGAVIAKTIRKIFIGEKIKSGRYYFCFDDIVSADYNSNGRVLKREILIKQILAKK